MKGSMAGRLVAMAITGALTAGFAGEAPAQGGLIRGLLGGGKDADPTPALPAAETTAEADAGKPATPAAGAPAARTRALRNPPAPPAPAAGAASPSGAQSAADPNAGLRPQAQATDKQVKAGARKLELQLNAEKVPRDLFARYVGTWKGNSYVYTPGGRNVGRQAVEVIFAMKGDGTLEGKAKSFDRLAQQFVVAESYSYRMLDASSVRISITRPTGQTDTQTGRFNDGALILAADIKDGVETYRERVDGDRLLIDGVTVIDGQKGAARDVRHIVVRLVRDK